MSFLFSSTNGRIKTMSMPPNLTVLLLSLLSLTITVCAAVSFAKELAPTTDWRKSGVGEMREKVTRLHFYMHDKVDGDNPTAVRIAKAASTDMSPSLFGAMVMTDDRLTVGPEPDSEEVGRAQGTYGSAGMKQGTMDFIMVMSFCFTHYGPYNGSCISMLGLDPLMTPVREMPIVGGSGVFQLARGVAMAKTQMFNATTLDSIEEYTVTVLHYD